MSQEEKAEEATGADVWRRKFGQLNKWFLFFLAALHVRS